MNLHPGPTVSLNSIKPPQIAHTHKYHSPKHAGFFFFIYCISMNYSLIKPMTKKALCHSVKESEIRLNPGSGPLFETVPTFSWETH